MLHRRCIARERMTAIRELREGASAGGRGGGREPDEGLERGLVQRCARGAVTCVLSVIGYRPDHRGVDVLVRARVSRSKKYAHWHVS